MTDQNQLLREALEAYRAAREMPSYGDYASINWQSQQGPTNPAFGGGDCAKHGRWYGHCYCCADDWEKLRKQADRDAVHARDNALRKADELARAALAQQPATGEPVKAERDQLRCAQADAVMPLIGPLLDAWENADREVISQEPELSRQLKAINNAMEGAQPATPEPVEAQCRFRRGKKDEVSDDVHLRAARLGFRPRSDAPCWKDVSADVRRDAARWRALVESGCELVLFRKGRRMLWAVRPCFTSYEYELFSTPEQAIDAMLAAKDSK